MAKDFPLGAVFSGITGGIGSLFGAFGRNKATNKRIGLAKDQQAKNEIWRAENANQDPTQFASMQRIINENTRRLSRAARAARGRAAVTGSDDIAEQQMAGAEQTGNLLAGVAAAGQQRADAINNQAKLRNDQLQDQIDELEGSKLNGWDVASGVIGGAAAGVEKGLGIDEAYKRLKG